MSKHENADLSDEWYTPKYVFDALGCIFDMDVAAPISLEFIKTPTNTFLTNRSLERQWRGFVWLNPPFGGRNGITPWLEKIHQHGSGIALTPDRTSCPWWQDTCLRADAHLQVKGKIKFINEYGKPGKAPANGTTLFAFGSEAVNALLKAQSNGLGLCFVHQFIPPLTKMKNKVIIVGDALCGSLAAAIAELNGLKIEIVRPEDMPAFEQPKPIEPIMIEPPYEFELFQPPITRRERRKQQRKSK